MGIASRCPDCHSDDTIGHEVVGVYDGVLYYSCTKCDWAWPREFVGAHLLTVKSRERVAAHLRARALRIAGG